MTTELQVRIARTEEELLPIFRLRYEVYVEQQGKPLPKADNKLRIVRDELDDVATNFYVGSDSGEIVACGRSTIGVWPQVCDAPFSVPAFSDFRRDDFYYISKVMLNPRARSRSAIPSMFIAMYIDGRRNMCPFGIANCNPKLVSIYSRFGWRQFGAEFMDPYAGTQVPILLVAPGIDHLHQKQSVLIDAAQEFSNDQFYAGWFERSFPEYATSGSGMESAAALATDSAILTPLNIVSSVQTRGGED